MSRAPPYREGADTAPAVELTLVPGASFARPAAITPATRAARAPPSLPSPLAGQAAPPVVAAAPTSPAARSSPPGPAATYPGFFVGGLPGCGREDIDLLTSGERARCRDAIETERARRTQALADADRARRLQDALSRPFDGVAPEKRAYYDAVQTAKAEVRDTRAPVVQPHGPLGMLDQAPRVTGGRPAGFGCSVPLGGKAPKRATPTGVFKLPLLPCVLSMGRGVLTEEVGTTPP